MQQIVSPEKTRENPHHALSHRQQLQGYEKGVSYSSLLISNFIFSFTYFPPLAKPFPVMILRDPVPAVHNVPQQTHPLCETSCVSLGHWTGGDLTQLSDLLRVRRRAFRTQCHEAVQQNQLMIFFKRLQSSTSSICLLKWPSY